MSNPSVVSTAAAVASLLASSLVMAGSAPAVAPYGTWRSPINAQTLAQGAISMRDVRVSDGTLYWSESRPEEKGRTVLMSVVGGKAMAVTPAGFDVRTRVHEYGGTPYVVIGDGIYFSHFADQRLYEQRGQNAPRALTPAGYRYADCTAHPAGDALICVREDHSAGNDVKNAIVVVKRSGDDAGKVLFGKSDFAAYPRVSADGKKLAWIAWDHPNMPWDTTTLYVADLSASEVKNTRVVTDGSNESVLEPQWASDGTLYFMSDRSDFWNLYAWRDGQTRAVTKEKAEFAGPLWGLGQSNYALIGDGSAVVRYGVNVINRLAVVDLKSGALREIRLPFVGYSSIQLRDRHHAAMVATAADQTPAPRNLEIDATDVWIGQPFITFRPLP